MEGKFKNPASRGPLNLVVSVCAKFEECAAKTVGGVGFLRVTGFSKKALLPNFASRLPV